MLTYIGEINNKLSEAPSVKRYGGDQVSPPIDYCRHEIILHITIVDTKQSLSYINRHKSFFGIDLHDVNHFFTKN